MRNAAATLTAATALLALAACTSADAADTLKENDPEGYAACDIFMNAPGAWAEGASDIEMAMGAPMVAYGHAKDAATPAIAASVDPELIGGQFGVVDSDKLIAACQDEGLEIHPDSMAQKRADHSPSS